MQQTSDKMAPTVGPFFVSGPDGVEFYNDAAEAQRVAARLAGLLTAGRMARVELERRAALVAWGRVSEAALAVGNLEDPNTRVVVLVPVAPHNTDAQAPAVGSFQLENAEGDRLIIAVRDGAVFVSVESKSPDGSIRLDAAAIRSAGHACHRAGREAMASNPSPEAA